MANHLKPIAIDKLERAAIAMDSLAALEASGKLEKIVSAMR